MMMKLMRTYHTAVHTYQCTCQSRTKLDFTESVHKRWEILSTIFSVNVATKVLVILHVTTDTEAVSVDECNASFRCCQMLLKYMFLYSCNIKKIQPKNPQMQHHPPCSREVFRHWWVTIIKTPKARKMTKATLIDSFYASYLDETLNYVADCADRPCCPFVTLINKLTRELDIRERRGGVCWRKIFVSFQENCRKHQNNPITTGLTSLCWCRLSKTTKRAISQHVMLQPDNFVISNISKHLAQMKTPHFFFWNLNWVVLHFNNVNKKKKKKKERKKKKKN